MDDIRAVMDAAGCERAALVGDLGGRTAHASLFAATYPERGVGAGALGHLRPRSSWLADYQIGLPREDLVEQLDRGPPRCLGLGEGAALLRASVPDDPETRPAPRPPRAQRRARRRMVVEVMRKNAAIDVRERPPGDLGADAGGAPRGRSDGAGARRPLPRGPHRRRPDRRAARRLGTRAVCRRGEDDLARPGRGVPHRRAPACTSPRSIGCSRRSCSPTSSARPSTAAGARRPEVARGARPRSVTLVRP